MQEEEAWLVGLWAAADWAGLASWAAREASTGLASSGIDSNHFNILCIDLKSNGKAASKTTNADETQLEKNFLANTASHYIAYSVRN
jgi:hypothetical protein